MLKYFVGLRLNFSVPCKIEPIKDIFLIWKTNLETSEQYSLNSVHFIINNLEINVGHLPINLVSVKVTSFYKKVGITLYR